MNIQRHNRFRLRLRLWLLLLEIESFKSTVMIRELIEKWIYRTITMFIFGDTVRILWDHGTFSKHTYTFTHSLLTLVGNCCQNQYYTKRKFFIIFLKIQCIPVMDHRYECILEKHFCVWAVTFVRYFDSIPLYCSSRLTTISLYFFLVLSMAWNVRALGRNCFLSYQFCGGKN